jgi:hypothetical protein
VYVIRGGEGVEFGVVKLTTIVTMYGRKRQTKLGIDERVKRGNRDVSIGFWRRGTVYQKCVKSPRMIKKYLKLKKYL